MTLVAGIDGGATHTRVAIVEESGRVLGVGQAGPSNYNNVPLSRVKEHISQAITEAFRQTDIDGEKVDALFLGMAGVVSQDDKNTILQVAQQLDIAPASAIEVDHDIRIALAGGLGGAEGIALIVGTGSSCYGRREDGRRWMAGGWGRLLDDKGSGFDLVRQAMIATVRAFDGRGPSTRLTGSILEGLRIESVHEIMRRLYYEGFSGKGHPMAKEEIASLAPLVLEAFEVGDQVATAIVQQGIEELTLMVRTVVDQLGFPPAVSVVMTGGLVEGNPAYKEMLCDAIQHALPESRIRESMFPPVVGAALLALQLHGVAVNQSVLQHLDKSSEQLTTEQ